MDYVIENIDGATYIEVPREVLEEFTGWFPDCNGLVDVSDAIDALHGYGILEGPIFDLLTSLDRDGVESFTPYCKEMTADEVIEQIADVLAEADGDFIEHIANQVLGRKVRYEEDSIFVFEDSQ